MLSVLHEDEALLVLDKPAGLLCVPGRGADKQDCLSARAQARYPDALIVHRLDMATSGLVLMARGPANQRRLGALFEARQVHKRYEALVAGLIDAADGDEWQTIDLPIAADWPNRPRQMVDATRGKQALTRWRMHAEKPASPAVGFTRLDLEPLTGRTHQLRVHLAATGHPILGDALYGLASTDPPGRLMLHAAQLALAHPQTAQWMQFDSVVPF